MMIAQEILYTGKHFDGCIIPVTTEDPSLIIHETNPESKRWGILFFIGTATKENCIAVINSDTDFTKLHSSILTTAVINRDGTLKGSVVKQINKYLESKG
jgi:hypothetical protein